VPRFAYKALAALAAAALVLFAAACAGTRPAPAPAAPAPQTSHAPQPAPPGEPPSAGPAWSEEGEASWYGGDDGFEGKLTASGEVYDSSRLTAAHRELPLGTLVEVTNVDNGRSVRVRINDRGPFARGRILDVSREAARRLGIIGRGVGRVRVSVVSMGPSPTAVPSGMSWTVQVGSFADPDRARRVADRVRETGRTTYLEPYGGLSRVKVGPFPSREAAASALRELEDAGFEGIVVPK